MYTITWEEYAMKDLNAVMLVVLLTTIVLYFFTISCLEIFLQVGHVSPVTVFHWIWEAFWAVAPHSFCTHFWSSVRNCSIHLAEIVSTYKLRFKMKCTGDSDMLTALANFQLFSWLSRHLPYVLQSQVDKIFSESNGLSACQKFLSVYLPLLQDWAIYYI